MTTPITHIMQNCTGMIFSGAVTVERLLQHLLESQQDVIILTDDDQTYRGIISVTALFKLMLGVISDQQLSLRLTQHYPQPVLTLDTDTSDLNAAFQQTDLQVLPVVNDTNGVIGMVRRSQLSTAGSVVAVHATPSAAAVISRHFAPTAPAGTEHVPDCVRCSSHVLRRDPARTITGSQALRILRDTDHHHRFW